MEQLEIPFLLDVQVSLIDALATRIVYRASAVLG